MENLVTLLCILKRSIQSKYLFKILFSFTKQRSNTGQFAKQNNFKGRSFGLILSTRAKGEKCGDNKAAYSKNLTQNSMCSLVTPFTDVHKEKTRGCNRCMSKRGRLFASCASGGQKLK